MYVKPGKFQNFHISKLNQLNLSLFVNHVGELLKNVSSKV